MKQLFAVAVLAVAVVAFVGCKSSKQEGVTTSYLSQWTTVNADTEKTTEAAKAVLEAEGLKDVTANATKVDGTAKAKKADGTKVNVSIKKKDAASEVSVSVGTLGDPTLGADLAAKIKAKAEAK